MKTHSHIVTEKGRKFCRMPKRFFHSEDRFTREEFMEIVKRSEGVLIPCRYCFKSLVFKDDFQRMAEYQFKFMAALYQIPVEKLLWAGHDEIYDEDEDYHQALTDLQKLPGANY